MRKNLEKCSECGWVGKRVKSHMTMKHGTTAEVVPSGEMKTLRVGSLVELLEESQKRTNAILEEIKGRLW